MNAEALSAARAGPVLDHDRVESIDVLRGFAVLGILVMNVNDRSSNTVISAGIMDPACEEVRSLYSLQNCIMLTPC